MRPATAPWTGLEDDPVPAICTGIQGFPLLGGVAVKLDSEGIILPVRCATSSMLGARWQLVPGPGSRRPS
jgi:hypothetical protein